MSQTTLMVSGKPAKLLELIFGNKNKLSLASVNAGLAAQKSPLRVEKHGRDLTVVSKDPSIKVDDLKVKEGGWNKIYISSVLPIAVVMSSSFMAYVVWLANHAGLI